VCGASRQILQYFPRLRERMDVAADYLSGGEQQMWRWPRDVGNVKCCCLTSRSRTGAALILELLGCRPVAAHTSIVIVEHI